MTAEIPQRILDQFERNLIDCDKPELFTEDLSEQLKDAIQILLSLSKHQQKIIENGVGLQKLYLNKVHVEPFESFNNLNLKASLIHKLVLNETLEAEIYQTSITGLFYLEYCQNDKNKGAPAACLI